MKHHFRPSLRITGGCKRTGSTVDPQRRSFQTSILSPYPLVSKAVERRRDTIEHVQRLTHGGPNGPRPDGPLSRPGRPLVSPIDIRARGTRPPGDSEPVKRRLPSVGGRSSHQPRGTRPAQSSTIGMPGRSSLKGRPRTGKRQKGGVGHASASSEDWRDLNELTSAEKDYAKERADKEDSRKDWEPLTSIVDGLDKLSPRLPIGKFGILETLRHRMRAMGVSPQLDGDVREYQLAQTLLDGKFVNFDSKVEMSNTISLADSMNKSRSDKLIEAKGHAIEFQSPNFEGITNEDKGIWERSLLGGKYEGPADHNFKGSVAKIVHLLRKNESYTGLSESQLLRKLSSFNTTSRLPGQPLELKEQKHRRVAAQ